MAETAFAFLDPGRLKDEDLILELVEKMPADPLRGRVPAYEFSMRVDGQTAGRINLRARTTPALEHVGGHVGYAVDERFRGHRYAERACRLLFPLARACGHEELWITCDPDNWPSRRTLERLGAEMVEIVTIPEDSDMYLRGKYQKCRYKLRI